MDPLLLVVVPLAGALACALDPGRARRLIWLVLAAAAHLTLSGFAWSEARLGSRWLALSWDPLGGLVLTLVSVIFLAVAIYGVGYSVREVPRGGRLFEACLLAFLATASLVCLTDHLGVMWVAMEATTLATAPLIYDARDHHSIEAVWKYLLLCSVGIALALLGTFMLAVAQGPNAAEPMLVRAQLSQVRTLHPLWFKAAFVFLFIGYGTKVGLVPMHTWLPDAHGEAPSPISALLSGALLNVAFLAILRIVQIAQATGQRSLVAPVLIGFGLASMLVAGALLIRQRNYKRMLAYSSIEHMGIVAVGCGLGQVAVFGALLHMIGSSLCKAVLFFTSGTVQIAYGSKRIADVSGLVRRLPVTGTLFLLGFFALSGIPPSAPFVSELTILRGAVAGRETWVAVAFLAIQTLVFVGLVVRVAAMAQGGGAEAIRSRESAWLVLPSGGLLLLVVVLGVYLAPPLRQVLGAAAGTLGGTAP